MSTTRARVAGLVAVAMLLIACSTEGDGTGGGAETAGTDTPSSRAEGHTRHGGGASGEKAGAAVPLRPGERVLDVAMPAAYTPSAPHGGNDDYRCFLLDPELEEDAFITGVDVAPGDPEVVHHVILFHVPPGQVAAAERVDADTRGQGWTCFGGSGLETLGGSLDNAPWLGAWAPGGGEQVLEGAIGIPVEAGSRIVLQVHYNLLAGDAPDRSSARLRVTDGTRGLEPLETTLLAAPVELPCRPGRGGPLCDRDAAVLDVAGRFGLRAGQMVAGLQLLCGDGHGPHAGPEQSCTRPVRDAATVRAAAGHMHLLGRAIRIEVNAGTPQARTLLDIPVWDFDDQGSRPLRPPVRVEPGDRLTVTCRHDQELRDLLPAFEGQPERYVVWGEGTTDEMCLGVLLTTRS